MAVIAQVNTGSAFIPAHLLATATVSCAIHILKTSSIYFATYLSFGFRFIRRGTLLLGT